MPGGASSGGGRFSGHGFLLVSCCGDHRLTQTRDPPAVSWYFSPPRSRALSTEFESNPGVTEPTPAGHAQARPGWKTSNSADLYQVDQWSDGFFRINPQGRLEVQPLRSGPACDLFEVVQGLRRRGLSAPILLRFDQIIKSRVSDLQDGFAAAIEEAEYRGKYQLAYPVKVNQQFHVVETVRKSGSNGPLALEVGSKPELLGVLAIHNEPGALLICNGYKDSEYIELALLASKLGRRPIVVIEQLDELDLVLALSAKLDAKVELGIRIKPTSKGAGRWEDSAGDRAKFGLDSWQVLRVVERLESVGKTDLLKLLHFHVGSQITAIGAITRVLREATRVYSELAARCPSMCFFNAGGGLGVDYDGSRTTVHSSMNYSIREYAREIVYAVLERCTEADLPHPTIITESGRATVAHHSVLVVEATDVSPAVQTPPDEQPSESGIVADLRELLSELNIRNCRETLHEAVVLREEVLEQFVRGEIDLEQRATAERLLRSIVARIHDLASNLRRPLEELPGLESELNDVYFCNFSLFQSVPDSWALDQLFPVMPIQRLDEEPTRRGILADLTCDSDGRMDRFIEERGTSSALRLHPVLPDEPYYLAVFLVGAYQEILGDLHNLFGDTNAAHVTLEQDGTPRFSDVVRGDTLEQALQYVQFDPSVLFERLRISCELAIREGRMTEREARTMQSRYRTALNGYTYLVREDDL
ncbi:MAG: biosynthetic arginine decarboxylase [bacterium]|nr:biosynthetic arginine decarboxylase [bacterium]